MKKGELIATCLFTGEVVFVSSANPLSLVERFGGCDLYDGRALRLYKSYNVIRDVRDVRDVRVLK